MARIHCSILSRHLFYFFCKKVIKSNTQKILSGSILLFLIPLVLFNCSDSTKDVNGKSNNNIQGIRSEKIIKRSITVFSSSGDTIIYEFNKLGKKASYMRSNTHDSQIAAIDGIILNDNKWEKTIISYDDKGNESEFREFKNWKKYYNSTTENLSDVSLTKLVNEYDVSGKLTKTTWMDANDLISLVVYYSYDATNQLSVQTFIDSEGNITGKWTHKNGEIIKKVEFDKNGKINFTLEYIYDIDGKLLTLKRMMDSKISESIYYYDAQGNELACITKKDKGKIISQDSTFYNDKLEKLYNVYYGENAELFWKTTYQYFD